MKIELTVRETDRKALRLILRLASIFASCLVGVFLIYMLSVGPVVGVYAGLGVRPPSLVISFYQAAEKIDELMPLQMQDAYKEYIHFWIKLLRSN